MSRLIDRARNILSTPKSEWPLIATEADTVAGLYTRYILILAALPVLAGFVKMSLIGTGLPFTGASVRVGLGLGLTTAVVQYGLSLLAVFLLSLVVDALAPSFGGQKDRVQALKTVAYAYTASWAAGVAVLLPWIGWLVAIAGAIYSVYLLFLGLPHTMRTPPDRAGGYMAVIVLIAFVLGIVIGAIGGAIGGAAGMGAFSRGSGIQITTDDGSKVDIDRSALGKLEQMAQQLEAAGKKMEDASTRGDHADQQVALGEAMGALFSGGQGQVEALRPEQLKPFVPEQLAGLPRTRYDQARKTVMGSLQIATGKAGYQDAAGERSIDLEVTDMGGMGALSLLAGWALVQTERESDQGYERVHEKDGRRVHEKWDASTRAGTYELIIADRFLVQLEGHGLEMDQLRSAADSLDLDELDELRDEGRQP